MSWNLVGVDVTGDALLIGLKKGQMGSVDVYISHAKGDLDEF